MARSEKGSKGRTGESSANKKKSRKKSGTHPPGIDRPGNPSKRKSSKMASNK